jgi:hypothetical protein
MRAPVASAMGTDLQALGLDPKNLPPLEKLDPKALRGVMKLLARSLGGKCADCHSEGDFAAQTRRKKIATKMWDEFAAKLTTADGASSATRAIRGASSSWTAPTRRRSPSGWT